MFDAAAVGIPSVVNAGCLMGEIAEQEGLGIAVEWNDPKLLKEALLSSREMKVQPPKSSAETRLRLIEAVNALIKQTADEQQSP
jgi:hypothetical protein